MIRFMKSILLMVVLLSNALHAEELRLGRYYSDQMVLQRDKPTVIRGFAGAGAEVQVSFAGQEKRGKAGASGNWKVTLNPLSASPKGMDLTVKSGREQVILKDVVVGDVLLFGRQTTIDITLGRDDAGKKSAAALKKNPNFRAIVIRTVPAPKPQSDLDEKATTGWKQVDMEQALKMTAAACFLGLDLSQEVDVPVGIVDVNLGWYFPIAWLSRETVLEPVVGSGAVVARVGRTDAKYAAFLTGEPYGKKKQVITENPLESPLCPAVGYNGVINPLGGIGLKGVIVQLGNDYPYMYYEKVKADGGMTDRELMNESYIKSYDIRKEGFRMEPAMISRLPGEWRKALGDAELPLAFVSPPSSELWPYALHNREMREVQRRVTEEEAATAIVLPGMDAIPFSGQPRDEALLAERSLKWAMGALYEEKGMTATGPVYDRVEGEGTEVTIHFKEGTAKGLTAEEGALDHFEVADVGAEYVPAEALIDGETIRLSCDDVSRIFYVRYNWLEKPDQGLVNNAGLPAIPFRTENASHRWLVRYSEDDLPEEYSTPANTWKGGAVTLINAQLERIGYMHFSGWLGPLGVKTGPYGPNMGVREVMSGSPADGKLFMGDVIYSANGQMLGDEEEMVMAAAITESEVKDGRLVLGVHRDGKNLDVELKLAVLGRYSATSPWDCLKTERIVKNLEEYVVARGANTGYLYTDAMFLLGAGSPEHQWLVRKSATGMKGAVGNNWSLGYQTIYLSEYYLSTGDKRILPRIKQLCDTIAELQIKDPDSKRNGGWYGRGGAARSYPAMVHAGISAMLGMTLARECGVEVDPETFKRGLAYLDRKGAPVGQIIYGDAFRSAPALIDPDEMLAGKLSTSNGKIAEAAILYNLLGDKRAAYINSLISTHSWYSTRDGHGGNFWNDFWTPLGAAVHSKQSYIYFMKNHRWYRECGRMFNGCLLQQDRFGAGTGLALVVPRHRLRILGAPKSPFSPGAPQALKDALAAYEAKDYKRAEELAQALLDENLIDSRQAPTVSKLVEEAKRMQDGIATDLAGMATLIKQGRLHEAGVMLASLKPVIAEDDTRLTVAQEQLKNGKTRANDEGLYNAALKAGGPEESESKAESADELAKMKQLKKAAETAAAEAARTWECLTPEEFVPGKKKRKHSAEQRPAEEATKWRFTLLETRDNAPEDWMKPGFDDSTWTEVMHPVSWHLNHIALFRTTFTVKDRKAYDLLKFKSWVFRQQDMAIYLNGVLIGRINNIEKKTGSIENEFKKAAIDALKDGENTLAIGTRQNWRWGMLGMRVYNGGFDFMLNARLAGVASLREL